MMSFHNRTFLFAQLAYMIIVSCLPTLLPGADAVTTPIAMIGVWGIVALTYRSTSTRNIAGWWTLLIATTLLATGVTANIHYFTTVSDGTTDNPVLENPDARSAFSNALYHSDIKGGQPELPGRQGYGLMIAMLWKLTGVTIVSPIILNMLMILMSIIISGVISSRLLHSSNSAQSGRIASIAMIMTASVCYYLNSGTLLLKEAGTCLAFALIGLGLTTATSDKDNHRYKLFALYALGIALLCILRHTHILFAIAGVLILIPWTDKKRIKQAIPLLIIPTIAWGLMEILLNSGTLLKTADVVEGSKIQSAFFYDNDQHRFYNNLIGDYLTYPVWKRILLLPVSAITQFLVPFPWNFSRDMIFGHTLAYAHISYPWYIAGGLVLFFIATAWRTATPELYRFTVMGIILWLIPAYLFAGSVSRYALPMLPMLIPAAVYAITQLRKSKSFKIWGICYCITLTFTLIACYHMQQSAINP